MDKHTKAVIDAAKALCASITENDAMETPMNMAPKLLDLGQAVQDLEEEEAKATTPVTPDLLTALKSLISDIEGMQERPLAFPEQFGPFSESIDGDDGTTIEWPNLAISLQEVREIVVRLENGPVIEGELTKPGITSA